MDIFFVELTFLVALVSLLLCFNVIAQASVVECMIVLQFVLLVLRLSLDLVFAALTVKYVVILIGLKEGHRLVQVIKAKCAL